MHGINMYGLDWHDDFYIKSMLDIDKGERKIENKSIFNKPD